MKIVIANHGIFPDVVGGMERHTYHLAESLQNEGLDITVLVPEPKTETSFPFPVVHLPWPKRPLWLWSNYEFSRHVGHWIDENHPDIAFGQGFALWGYLSRQKVPTIFHPHGLEMFGGHLRGKEKALAMVFRILVRYHAKHSTAVVSLGGRLTDILKNSVDVDAHRLFEIPNAIDSKRLSRGSQTGKPNHLLFVGRLAFNKGIDLITEALATLHDPTLRLTIVGSGPFEEDVKRLSKKDSRVSWISNASEAQLSKSYENCEALLFTSRFEGMPTVILEAMASAKMILATNIGAVETMVDESNGILMEPKSKSIREGIQMFLNLSSEQKKSLGAYSRAHVEKKFLWKPVTKRYLELFHQVTSAKD